MSKIKTRHFVVSILVDQLTNSPQEIGDYDGFLVDHQLESQLFLEYSHEQLRGLGWSDQMMKDEKLKILSDSIPHDWIYEMMSKEFDISILEFDTSGSCLDFAVTDFTYVDRIKEQVSEHSWTYSPL